jgi:hypothetical protein
MSAITVTQSLGYDDTALAFQSVWVGGDTLVNNGRTFLVFRNSSGSSCTATLDTPATINGLAIANPTVTVTNANDMVLGPFDPTIFNTAAGQVAITYSGSTNTTTVAALTS